MEIPDFLTRTPEGETRIAGHAIGLYHVVHHYNEGESAEMLASRYPTLPLALVHKIIAFYLDNLEEVDAYVAECRAAMDVQQSKARQLDLSVLRQRLLTGEPAATENQ